MWGGNYQIPVSLLPRHLDGYYKGVKVTPHIVLIKCKMPGMI